MRFLIPLVLLMALCPAAEPEPKPSVSLRRLNDRVFVVEDTFYTRENSLVYVGPEHVTIIGATWTPATAALLHREIKAVTAKPIREVVNTNYHPDRAGGNAYWKEIGADIVATKTTTELLRREWHIGLAWTRRHFPEYPDLPLVLPSKSMDSNFSLQDGAIKALYLGPSHTPDGILVYLPREEILFGGCIVKPQLGNLEFADPKVYASTLARLRDLKLPTRTIVAGHGDPVHGPELLARYQELLGDHLRNLPTDPPR